MAEHAMGRRIAWIVEGLRPDGQGGHTSPLASHRYRVILPAEGLRDLGHEVDFIELDAWLASDRPAVADIVVIAKFLPGGDMARYQARAARLLDQARLARAQGAHVVADFNDDHFDHPQQGPYWRGLAEAAQVHVAGSTAMRARLMSACGRAAHVVGDPLGSPHGRVRVRRLSKPAGSRVRWWRAGERADDRLRLLWYGHPVNWAAMQAWLPRLVAHAASCPLSLQVVTQPLPQIVAALEAAERASEGRLKAECLPWDEATQWAALERCDIVLIPSDPDDARKAVKTANRLTDAIHAGRAVVASPLPAYKPWAAHVSLVDDPVEGLRHWMNHGDQVEAALLAGQAAVEQRCSVPAIAQAWLDAFSAVPFDAATSTADAPAGGVRINLGCGARHMAGFINVDFGENWSGIAPDVVADITKTLPFPDEHADEVHAYHVLEHILHWEVEPCLREWLRVLKPGGRLVLELPCLDKILSIFQAHLAAGTPAPVQLTMWGLFGDPGHKDVHMLHRWCYSEAELRHVLTRVGLVSITTEKALTHVPMRDMRMVGVKPLPLPSP
ncbi:methyltransferase domain-containing protein [Leptothrix discophora]|uniref:Methyltransferase domain-containing protein n=1 Tax=Leptothrix discophora TaxID=89 RepID=A0ABT9G6V2_LEPDI|nr:methyltransferase domain-containing protein [Leptothrix discophora]MDP4302221.1 methyltransferase domain-containing protein [Leptothrix discophora]